MCNCGECEWCLNGVASMDNVATELHYLLNIISDLPNGDKKTALWNATQAVCDIVTGG